jgi:hypothetical protein
MGCPETSENNYQSTLLKIQQERRAHLKSAGQLKSRTATRNSQNIKQKHADQPAKTRATPYGIHVLPLLNRYDWKQINVKNVSIWKSKMFSAIL